MKRKIDNTLTCCENFNCFACGPDHPFGLRLEFDYDDDAHLVSCRFRSNELFAGFPGILHGGIQATILDELAFWGSYARFGKSGFTYDLTIHYRRKCPTDTQLEACGIVGSIEKRLIPVDVTLWDPVSQEIFTRGTVRYFLPR